MRRFPTLALLLATATTAAADGPAITYNKDVAPILWKNCAGCHRPGEIGPFSLLTYRDAAKRAEFLKDVAEDRTMPPWKAEPGYGRFHDERRLSDDEIATIGRWADAGAPEGDPKDLPPAPKFPEGWQLGPPDLVVEMPEPFEVHAKGPDIYRCFVLPLGLDQDRTVAAVEFRPGNPRVVHHALFFLDRSGRARKMDEADPAPGYASFGGIGVLPTGSLGGWAPGSLPRRLPEGIGKTLQKGSDVVFQVHYHPDGKVETDRSKLGIYFTEGLAPKRTMGVRLATRQIDIPPGEAHYTRKAGFTLPVDVDAIGIFPHMHMLGREMKVTAILPDGRERPMIWIKDWDFDWQGQYQYAEPIPLPKGTRLELEAAYDNSADNPKNPSDPPRRVTFGEQTTDEMCLCAVQVVPKDRADAAALRRANVRAFLDGIPPGERAQLIQRLRREAQNLEGPERPE